MQDNVINACRQFAARRAEAAGQRAAVYSIRMRVAGWSRERCVLELVAIGPEYSHLIRHSGEWTTDDLRETVVDEVMDGWIEI